MEERDYAAKFGAQLSALRRQRRLSLEELARRAGLSKSSLSAYERGEGNPTLYAIGQLSAALSVPAGALLGEAEEALALERLKLEFALEVLQLCGGPGGPDELRACLSRCAALADQAAALVRPLPKAPGPGEPRQ